MGEFLKKLKNLPGRQRAKLAYALIGLVTSAAVLIAATTSFAWFSNNRDVDANRMQIVTEFDDLAASCAVYMWDVDNECGTDSDESGTLTLNQGKAFHTYDTIFVERNRYNPVIVEITVTGERYQGRDGTLTVTVERQHIITIPAETDENGEVITPAYGSDNTDSYFFTNVMSFACKKVTFTSQSHYGAESDPYKSEADQIYREAKNAFVTEDPSRILQYNDGVTPQKFVVNESKKTDTVSFNIDYEASDWNEDDELKVYLFINYNDTLARSILGDELDFGAGLVHTATVMANDLSRIYIGATAS